MAIDPELRQFATEQQLRHIDAIEHYGSGRAAAAALGLSHNTLNEAMRRLYKSAALRGYSPKHDMVHTVPDGFAVKGVSTYYDRDGKPRGQWVKSTQDQERRLEMLKDAAEAMSQEIPRLDPIERPSATMAHLANLYVITDYHMGMMAWRQEGGADWDLKIAERVLIGAFENMVVNSPNARVGVLAQLGDFLHADGLLPITPTSGHVLDADGRFSKVVKITIRALRRLVDMMLMKHETVHVIMAEGNHDMASSVWLRQMFSALYENEPRVTINDSELPYYSFQFGKVMLAFHHGHMKKKEALPLLFASQFPEMWGSTTYRVCHTGHQHHEDLKEHSGMRVHQHPTLAARDAHSSRHGWMADRQTSCITYHERFGKVGEIIVSPEMLVG